MYRLCMRTPGSRGRCIYDKGHALRYQLVNQRRQSTGVSKTPVAIKYVAGSLIGAGVVSLATVAYAGFDRQFRENLANKHDYVKATFDSLYGPTDGTEKDDDTFSKRIDDIVVVTTMDHQPGVSAVDLDIGNMDVKRRRAKKRDAKEGKGSSSGGSAPVLVSAEEASQVSSELIEGAKEIHSVVDTADVDAQADSDGKLPDSHIAEKVGEESKEELSAEAKDETTDISKVKAPSDALEVKAPDSTVTTEIVPPDTRATEETGSEIESTLVVKKEPSTGDAHAVADLAKSTMRAEDDVVASVESELDASIKEKSSIETILQVHLDKLLADSQEVVNAQKRAAGSIYTYVNQLGHALVAPEDDPAFYDTWKTTASLERDSQVAIDQAKNSETELQQKIDALRGMISAVRKYGPSEIADRAQEVSTNLSLKVQRTAEDVRKASNDLVSMVEYHTLAAKAKKEFEKGLGQLSEDTDATDESKAGVEASAMLVYALKKVEFLTKALEKRAQEEDERVLAALEKQRHEEEKRFEDVLSTEVRRVKAEDTAEHQKKEMELITRYEGEIRQQLKRQASAHREHLTDVLGLQAKELEEKHGRVLESKLKDQYKIYEDELERKVAFLQGVDDAVTSVVDIEEKNRRLRELWLGVQAIFSAFQQPLMNGSSRALMPEIVALKCRAGDNEVIQEALATIPSSVAKHGVATEAELARRFRRVKSISRKVAQVDEGGSLISYLMSYIRSVFILDIVRAKAIDEPIDPDNISTYEVLSKAEICVKAGDLEQAVKFMNLLRGIPRHVAQDWLDEAKAHLETRLALDFLLAFVRSNGAGTT